MKDFAIYLRKSRADIEAEARGEGETLARHRAALLALADKAGYHIGRIYQEIVSGDTIAARPQMQALLEAVRAGVYAGVIVNDIDRLGRGNLQDQGIIQQAFMASGTLIVTPQKVYNPLNDVDSDFFDMSLFMARFEYKQIKKRLQLGRARSAAEGNYQSGPVPFGFNKVRNAGKGGFTLEINEEQAEYVRAMYNWYAVERVGKNTIANRLNGMGVTTSKGNPWEPSAVYGVLSSGLYIGRYEYNRGSQKAQAIVCENAFPAIVDRELWDAVQAILHGNVTTHTSVTKPLVNPLAGILKCAICGKTMVMCYYRGRPSLKCKTYKCPTVQSLFEPIEKAILAGLRDWTIEYTAPAQQAANPPQNLTINLRKKLSTLEGQETKLYELVEQGVYSTQLFIQRRTEIEAQKDALKRQIEAMEAASASDNANIVQLVPKIRNVLDAYDKAGTAQEKNTLLKSILSRAEYYKTHDARGRFDNPAKYVTIRLYPRILK